jgi:hypothetical protein
VQTPLGASAAGDRSALARGFAVVSTDTGHWFSALDTIDYYERMTKANGGPDQVREWSRLYLVPGASHCGGGPSLDTFDGLSAIVRWVEQGSAPDSLTATGRAFPGRSRPLCAYPLHAHYKGQGNPEDAANFACR